MVRFGYTLMTEQSGPKQIVEYGARAEQVGFDFEVSSDHYSPWLVSQGHAGYAWTMLGAVAALTSTVELMTYVTSPIQRYHPAVVAQKAATLQILSDGRFTLGVGSGENLNEHITGEGWAPIAQRQDMLEEAVTIIRELHTGELVTWEGSYFRIDSARVWDVPDQGVPIGIAVSGPTSIERFAPLGDHLIAVEPDADAVKAWDKAKGGLLSGTKGSRKIGQIPICWGPDKDAAIAKAHDQFRWFGGGWGVNADLPTPHGFAGGEPVRPPGGRGGVHPLRPRPRRHRRGGQPVLGGRLHRRRGGPGRRRGSARLPRPGRPAPPRRPPQRSPPGLTRPPLRRRVHRREVGCRAPEAQKGAATYPSPNWPVDDGVRGSQPGDDRRMGRFVDDLAMAVRPRESAVLDEDGVAEHTLRTSRWERTARGLYVPAGSSRTTTQRILSAAALLPPGGVIGGWSAAYVHGADHLDGLDQRRRELPVDVLLPPGLHRLPVPGVEYRRAALGAGETTLVHDLPVTSPLRTALDLARCSDSVTEATACLDLMLQAGLGLAELRDAVPARRRGAVQARRAIALARRGSRSPGETRLRLLYGTEFPAAVLLLNPTLLDAGGRFVAMPDLFDEEAGLALEYDGARWDSARTEGHRDRRQHREDNAREEAVERLGVVVVRADAADLGPHERQTAYRLRQARADGLGRDRGRDRWILKPAPNPDEG